MAESPATDLAKGVLAGIIPNRRDRLEKATRKLRATHFPDRETTFLFECLVRYLERYGFIITKPALESMLRATGADAGKIALFFEFYDLLASKEIPDDVFEWTIDELRERQKERVTGELLAQSMEILNRGAEDERGNKLRGADDARSHLLGGLAELDSELNLLEAPEGDVRVEAAQIVADYAARKEVRVSGGFQGMQFGIPGLDAKLDGGLQAGDLDLLLGYTSSGKAQPLDAQVLTPDRGFIRMGDVQPGDAVVDPEGAASRVTGVFPQGVLPVYKLTFSDGSTVEASGDHLWAIEYWKPVREASLVQGVRGRQQQIRVRETWTTEQLRVRVLGKSRNPALVESAGLLSVDFPEGDLPLDPYLLGLLLGDGCMSGTGAVSYTSADPELVDACRELLPPGVVMQQVGMSGRASAYQFSGMPELPVCLRCRKRAAKARSICRSCWATENRNGRLGQWPSQRRLPILTGILKGLDLYGSHSWDKHVPGQYKTASATTRLAVLQGLMDTDGNDSNGRAEFSSASRQLRDDVVWLARSLGLQARVSEKSGSYTVDDVAHEARHVYRAWVYQTSEVPVFRLVRKQKFIPKRAALRKVVSVEYVRDAECQCIMVSAPSHLYVTDDFIPTHNTSLLVQLAHNVVTHQGKNVVIATSETLRSQFIRRLISRHSREPQFELATGLDSRDLKGGTLPDHLEDKFQEVVRDFTRNPSYGRCVVAQVPRGATINDVGSIYLRWNRQFEVHLALMDYLQLLSPVRRRDSTREEQSNTVKDAKTLAASFDGGRGLALVSPWQVNRTARDKAVDSGRYELKSSSETAEASNSADIIVSLLEPEEITSRYVSLLFQVLKNRDGLRTVSLDVAADFATSHFATKRQSEPGEFLGDDGLSERALLG